MFYPFSNCFNASLTIFYKVQFHKDIDQFTMFTHLRIKIQAYNNSVEVSTDYPQRKYQIIDIPPDADIETVKSTYKNGILEIVFKKKTKLKRNNKRRK
ncbi:MAG: hypothetical protein DLM72_19565 [Candidatus Nitrosopolaris wilkensis]|nr:MAG: hypothetical protein DLM72_19565 [Candidatus Nitrosopolaris wilkensis]